MKRLTSLALVTLSALTISACGLRGSLERPDPLWGDPDDFISEREAEAATRPTVEDEEEDSLLEEDW